MSLVDINMPLPDLLAQPFAHLGAEGSLRVGAVSDPQRSEGWHRARLGKVTASRLGDLTARTKTGWSTSRGAYLNQLLVERLTGQAAQSPVTPAMRWGVEQEPLARAAYSFRTDRDALLEGFVEHPHIPMSGASPDGLVGNDGLIEIKCPTTATHLETLSSSEVPAKHLPQIYWQMACTGRTWCDFVSFDPRLPEPLRLVIRRVPRDQAVINALEAEVTAFLQELEDRMVQLTTPVRRAA
ncbi:MAG: YqaJ viral recombinase family protein [Pseudomonadota bacterium]|nr:YqaJ viral recombinase family protein [Pseudomonadota bacterium]